MDKEQLAKFRKILAEEKQELRETLTTLDRGLEESLKSSVQELSSYDQHSTDLGSETLERSKDLGLRDNTRLTLAAIQEAMERIDDGTYGICESCGKKIPIKRLEALPWTTSCYPCKEGEEHTQGRGKPMEEDVLDIPFHRSFTDGTGQVGYDGEDTWQELERYGNANSPQDNPDAIDYSDNYYDGDEDVGMVEQMDGIMDLGHGSSETDEIYPSPRGGQKRRKPHQE